jgi:hypothetical protein
MTVDDIYFGYHGYLWRGILRYDGITYPDTPPMQASLVLDNFDVTGAIWNVMVQIMEKAPELLHHAYSSWLVEIQNYRYYKKQRYVTAIWKCQCLSPYN